jgi:lysophospholipase L1-like esterase
MMTKKPIMQNLAMLLAACAVCVLGLEASLRLFPQLLPEEAMVRLHWHEVGDGRDTQGRLMTIADPYLGFRYRPNFTARLSRRELDFTFTTDDKGFRNPSSWPEQADIVVVGDSMAFGYGVADHEAWTHQVARELPKSTIMNLGLIGAGPQQYLRVLETYGLDLQPKLVLFMLFPANDLTDAERFEGWLDADTDLTYPEWRATGGSFSGWGPVRRLLNGSYLVAFLLAAQKSLTSPLAGETITFADGERIQLAPTTRIYSARMADPTHPVFQLVMTTIQEASRLAQEHGSHFLVLLMPAKEEVYLPLLGKPVPTIIGNFRSALEARQLPFIDLTPHFQTRAQEIGPVFFEVDGHPNEKGYSLIARVLIDYLREHGQACGLEDWQPERQPSRPGSF